MKCCYYLILSSLLTISGCQNNIFKEYKNDAAMATYMGKQGNKEALKKINSSNYEERKNALKVLAELASRAEKRGNKELVEQISEVIINKYKTENKNEVKYSIITVCAPIAGKNNPKMIRFLKERIALGEYPGEAAISIAEIQPNNAYKIIIPLIKHPAHLVRYKAALALTITNEKKAIPYLKDLYKSMNVPPWPDEIDGITTNEAKEILKKRTKNTFNIDL